MIALMIGAAMSGLVLGATSRIIFLLPAALMALMIAAVLVVRADIDLGFTALTATLLNSGFLLGIVMTPVMSRLGLWPCWTVDEAASGFVVRDRFGRALACVGFDGRPAADSLLYLLAMRRKRSPPTSLSGSAWSCSSACPFGVTGSQSNMPVSSLLPANADH